MVGYGLENYRRLHEGVIVEAPCYAPSALGDTVASVLADLSRRAALSEQAFKHAKQFDNDAIAERDWETLMRQVSPAA